MERTHFQRERYLYRGEAMSDPVFPLSVIDKAAEAGYKVGRSIHLPKWESISAAPKDEWRDTAKASLLAAFAEMERIGMAERGYVERSAAIAHFLPITAVDPPVNIGKNSRPVLIIRTTPRG